MKVNYLEGLLLEQGDFYRHQNMIIYRRMKVFLLKN